MSQEKILGVYFKTLKEKLKANVNLFLPIYDPVTDKDYKMKFQTFIDLINSLSTGKEIYALPNISNTGNDYITTFTNSYSQEQIYLFQPSANNTGNATLATLPIYKFDGDDLIELEADDLDTTNTYIFLYKGTYWLANISYGSGTPISNIYTGASPATENVGGITSGYILTGKTYDQILEKMLIKYQTPSFSSFLLSGQSTLLEVGQTLSGNKTAVWGTNNSSNILANSVQIRDVTANTLLASGLANDGNQIIDIGTITNTSPMSRSWRVEATEQNDPVTNDLFTSGLFTVSSIYPVFYGKVSSGGVSAGLNRPSPNQILINSGNKILVSSTGTVSVNFGSSSDDYTWIAIPVTSAAKTSWYVNALNNGAIGGSISAGGNLYPAPNTVSINSPTSLWTGVNYRIYISNYQSAINTIEFRN